MRLIDADALKGNFAEIAEQNDMIAFHRKVVEIFIDMADTVDTVKHGHWMSRQGGMSVCSICGDVHFYSAKNANMFLKFCPKCGARMDEEVSE